MNIEDKIREFIIKNLYYAEGATLGNDASFLAEGVIDSMGAMELVAFVESEFKLKVEMSEVVVKNFDSISKMADFVRRKSQSEAAEQSRPYCFNRLERRLARGPRPGDCSHGRPYGLRSGLHQAMPRCADRDRC